MPLGLHAPVNRLQVLHRQIGALQANVHYLDAVFARFLVARLGDHGHQLRAVFRHDITQVLAAKLLAQFTVDNVVEPRLRPGFVADGAQKLQRVDDAPAREVIHHEGFLVLGDDLRGVGVILQQAAVEIRELLHEWNPILKPRFTQNAHGLAEPGDDHLPVFTNLKEKRIDREDENQDQNQQRDCLFGQFYGSLGAHRFVIPSIPPPRSGSIGSTPDLP